MKQVEIKFVTYDKTFLNKSWIWLNNEEIKKLTMTPEFTKEEQIKWYNSIKVKKDYLIWGITCDNIPVGVCGLKNIKKKEGEYWGYIGEKSYWGKGIGKMMMNMIIDKARELKLKKIYLKILLENYRAINLYRKFNFVTTDNQKDVAIMTLDLI